MKRVIRLTIMILVLSGCKTTVALKDTPPELNREFGLGQDVPSDYRYCRKYEQKNGVVFSNVWPLTEGR